MCSNSGSCVALEEQLTQRLLDFERLDEAWPKGRPALERAEIGRRREAALSEIRALGERIASAHDRRGDHTSASAG